MLLGNDRFARLNNIDSFAMTARFQCPERAYCQGAALLRQGRPSFDARSSEFQFNAPLESVSSTNSSSNESLAEADLQK